jgi:hypothetical protein
MLGVHVGQLGVGFSWCMLWSFVDRFLSGVHVGRNHGPFKILIPICCESHPLSLLLAISRLFSCTDLSDNWVGTEVGLECSIPHVCGSWVSFSHVGEIAGLRGSLLACWGKGNVETVKLRGRRCLLSYVYSWISVSMGAGTSPPGPQASSNVLSAIGNCGQNQYFCRGHEGWKLLFYLINITWKPLNFRRKITFNVELYRQPNFPSIEREKPYLFIYRCIKEKRYI